MFSLRAGAFSGEESAFYPFNSLDFRAGLRGC